jgi:hypothetical protein
VKIHTLITLGISHRTKPLVFWLWSRCTCEFDSHRPLHFRPASGRVRILDRGQHVDPVGKRWERTPIWRQSRVLRCPYAAPAFTRTVTWATSKNNVCDSHTLWRRGGGDCRWPDSDPQEPDGTDPSRASRRLARPLTTFWQAVHSWKTYRGAVSMCRQNGARSRCIYHGRGPCQPCHATHTRQLQLPWDHDQRRR